MTFKGIVLFLHRWLGIISGLVVFIVSITGCIFCFQDEIQDAVHSWRKVLTEDKAYISPSALKQNALNIYPKATVDYIYYFGKDRSAAVLANVPQQGYIDVYFNPYSGRVLHSEGLKENFFTIIQYIHLYLLLPVEVGRWVVGVSVMLFLVIMITGIVLWWPKRKADRKRSFTIKWKGRWKRVNYDLHNVLGFYSVSIALILATTGLAIAFEPVDKVIYSAANLGKAHPQEQIVPKSDTVNPVSLKQPVIDRTFDYAICKSPHAQMFLLTNPKDKSGTIQITAYAQTLNYGHSDNYYFDKYSGALLKTLPYAQKSLGMKTNDLNYDIHVGQALGLTGKIFAFTTSLICASLPITGLIIWLGKKGNCRFRKSASKKPCVNQAVLSDII